MTVKTTFLPKAIGVLVSDSTMRVEPVFGEDAEYVAVDSVRFRERGEPEATWAFVSDAASDRAKGVEAAGSIGATSLARVSALDALGTFGTIAAWIVSLGFSIVVMLFGVVRWLVRRARDAPDHWQRIRQRTWDAHGRERLPVDFGTAVRARSTAGRHRDVANRAYSWTLDRMSRWTVRGVATLNVIAVIYRTLSGWIGWRTWA